jgi:hypothetical protein
MKPLVMFALISNLVLIVAFGFAFACPRTRPTARRFFRWLAWLNLTFWVAQAGACQFNVGNALSVLTATIIPMIEGLLPLIASATAVLLPAESAAITAAEGIAMTGLQALEKLLQEYEANPNDTTLAAFQDGVNSVHDQLNSLLAAAQVKDAKTAQKITAIVNAAFQSLATIEALIMAKHPQTVAAHQAAQAS